ncbi:hypothetical protein [Chitinophaga silvisoli]|nr:hypothetical protein [Chitinophaga silvisoli]
MISTPLSFGLTYRNIFFLPNLPAVIDTAGSPQTFRYDQPLSGNG